MFERKKNAITNAILYASAIFYCYYVTADANDNANAHDARHAQRTISNQQQAIMATTCMYINI
jgi:hypothetical protein